MSTTFRSLLADRGLKLSDVARAIGVDKATVTRWAQSRVPAERVIDVERATSVPRHLIRPDLYPEPPSAVPVQASADDSASVSTVPSAVEAEAISC